MPPTLYTERLTLRAARKEDWPDFAAFMTSPRARYIGGPSSTAYAWGAFCHETALWTLFGHGGLMIVPRDTTADTAIGVVEVNAGPLFPETELGWTLYDGWEGHGYATEAARALRDWAYRERGLATLVSYIDPENAPSQRVAERLGATLDPAAAVQDPGDLVYRHPNPQVER